MSLVAAGPFTGWNLIFAFFLSALSFLLASLFVFDFAPQNCAFDPRRAGDVGAFLLINDATPVASQFSSSSAWCSCFHRSWWVWRPAELPGSITGDRAET